MHGNKVFVHDVLCKRKKLPNLNYEVWMRGGVSMRRILHKSVDIALSMLAIIATVFANCQCTGRAYEPEVPEELK